MILKKKEDKKREDKILRQGNLLFKLVDIKLKDKENINTQTYVNGAELTDDGNKHILVGNNKYVELDRMTYGIDNVIGYIQSNGESSTKVIHAEHGELYLGKGIWEVSLEESFDYGEFSSKITID